MNRQQLLVLSLTAAMLAPAIAAAKRVSPVQRFCRAEPVRDPAQIAGRQRAERVLEKIQRNKKRVFAAYRREYDRNRQQIISRNQRLPKGQHMTVPPKRSDDQLRAKPEYKNRLRDVGADVVAENQAMSGIDREKRALAAKQTTYQGCKNRILGRMRTAATKSAVELLATPIAERLAEETGRLEGLRTVHKARLEQLRKEKSMGPVLSAGICARNDLMRELDRTARATKRDARSSGTDPAADLARLKEERRSHELEVIELKRDFKLLRIRRKSCRSRDVKPLVECVRTRVRSPSAMPVACKGRYEDQLELLGLWERPFK